MKIETKKAYVLTLTVQEAAWLNAVMQNPLNGGHPNDEDRIDSENRRRFFEATQEAQFDLMFGK